MVLVIAVVVGWGFNNNDDLDVAFIRFIVTVEFAWLNVFVVGPGCQVCVGFPRRLPPMVLSRVAAVW